MLKPFIVSIALLGLSSAALAQTPPAAAPPLQLTVEQAVRMALDSNVDLAVQRLEPQISDTDVAAAFGAFKPLFGTSLARNDALDPPASFFLPTATRTDVVTSEVALSHRLRRFGTSYSFSWNTAHTDSNSILSSYNPLIQSGLGLSVSQPLIRNFGIDTPRLELALSQANRAIADTGLRETLVHVTADVKTAYWNLVAARAAVDAKQSALDLAQELARVNKVKVDVGQSPPLDVVAAQAEVADYQEQLIVAETAVKLAEDRLRMLIFDPTRRDIWNTALDPIDPPLAGTASVDVEAAVNNALANRTDLDRARKDISVAATNVLYSANQRLPDVRVNGSYRASGLGGTQILRTGGFPGNIVGGGPATDFLSVMGQLFSQNYPTWALGVSVSYPIGQSTEEATWARNKLEQVQAEARVKSLEGQAIQQVRRAAWQIDMDAKRIETTRVARELAEQRLDAERKRYDVGMSTNFLVIQAQRDLADAKINELSAILGYDLALVDFEELQQAGPSGQNTAASAAQLVGR